MARLLNRQKQIPNGFQFRQPEINWQAPRFASFDVIVNGLIAARNGNPHLTQKHNWPTDYNTVAEEVDAYNARICEMMGWSDYITATGGPPPPKSLSPQNQREISAAGLKGKKIWAGVRTLNDWLDSGEPAVDQSLAESRAATCAACPKNGKGEFESWFTKPASEVIRKQLEKAHHMALSTTNDDNIQVCNACLCPLKLKVHTPMKFITPHLKPEVIQELKAGLHCWIIAESK